MPPLNLAHPSVTLANHSTTSSSHSITTQPSQSTTPATLQASAPTSEPQQQHLSCLPCGGSAHTLAGKAFCTAAADPQHPTSSALLGPPLSNPHPPTCMGDAQSGADGSNTCNATNHHHHHQQQHKQLQQQQQQQQPTASDCPHHIWPAPSPGHTHCAWDAASNESSSSSDGSRSSRDGGRSRRRVRAGRRSVGSIDRNEQGERAADVSVGVEGEKRIWTEQERRVADASQQPSPPSPLNLCSSCLQPSPYLTSSVDTLPSSAWLGTGDLLGANAQQRGALLGQEGEEAGHPSDVLELTPPETLSCPPTCLGERSASGACVRPSPHSGMAPCLAEHKT